MYRILLCKIAFPTAQNSFLKTFEKTEHDLKIPETDLAMSGRCIKDINDCKTVVIDL